MASDRSPERYETITVSLDKDRYIGKTDRNVIAFPCTDRNCCPGFIPQIGRGNYYLEYRNSQKKPGRVYGIFHDIRTRRRNFVDFEPPVPGKLCVYPIGAIDQVGGAFVFVNFPYAILVDCGAIVKTQDFDTDYSRIKTEVLEYLPGLYELLSQYNLQLKGIFLTHGHLDHIGAVPFLGSIDNQEGRVIDRVPIFASTITYQFLLKVLGAAAKNAAENEEDDEDYSPPRMNPFDLGLDRRTRDEYSNYIIDMKDGEFRPGVTKTFDIGNAFSVTAVPMNHSIPGAYGFLVEAQGSRWFYTGDSKIHGFDEESAMSVIKSYQSFGRLDGVITDALGVNKDEMTPPESTVVDTYRQILRNKKYETVYFLSFGSNIARSTKIRELCAEPEIQRTVHWEGVAQKESFVIATHFYHEAKNLPIATQPTGRLVIGTGAQFETYSFGWRLAHKGGSRDNRITEDDWTPEYGAKKLLILASRPIPGNENAIKSGIIALLAQGIDVVVDTETVEELELGNINKGKGTLYSAHVHVSGHGSKEDMKILLNATRPKTVVPTHCESRDVPAFQQFVESLGLSMSAPTLGNYLR